MTPEFIDNRAGNTMARALAGHLATHRTAGLVVPQVDIATAYFNPQGFHLLHDELQHVGQIRLMLGAEPKPESETTPPMPGDPPEPEYTRRQVQAGLTNLEKGLARDRDRLAFTPQTTSAIRDLIAILRSGRIQVRRFEQSFLHAKAYIFRRLPVSGVIAGSSNLTHAGLARNLELNLGIHGSPTVTKAESWFDDLWGLSQPFDLAAIYEAIFQTYPPYLIYLKVLQLLYGDEVDEERAAAGRIPATTFQQHGAWRALRILEKYHGVLVADGVGLGKTFTAGYIIERYRERRQRVLLICPAALRDSTWKEFCNRFSLFLEVVSYEELANDRQLGGERPHLNNPIEEYSLIVVDEAHAYRNPDAPSRAKILRRLLYGPPKDLLLLTATPVNNSLWDLFHLLRYFIKQDAQLAERGVLSIQGTFKRAMKEDPFSLSPDVLYPIIDATTVKRTRQFVKKHYEHDSIRDDSGAFVPIVFPKPIPLTVRYKLDSVLPGFFERIAQSIAPEEEEEPLLKLARYNPDAYRRLGPAQQDNRALLGLIRSGLLKRFESSCYAFARTARRMVREHDLFLDALKRGYVLTTEFLQEIAVGDDDVDLGTIVDLSRRNEPADHFDTTKLRKDVKSDRDLLDELASMAETVTRRNDPKLAALIDELAEVVQTATKEGLDEEDAQQRRKVLLFSFFADTVDWIEDHLVEAALHDPRLAVLRGRIASVSGQTMRGAISREDAVFGFAPISAKAPPETRDQFDLLITTDVLAEGLNLQQARHIINYDLPWNPQRLVQRHGRIDRIGSKHPRVYLRTIFPDDRLDDLLRLEERIYRKLAHAAASVGVETAPIVGASEREQVFSETRHEIEKLYQENPELYEKGGTASAAQTGEEYRQELRKALLVRASELEWLPWKAGSGMRKGNDGGYFFCATVGGRVFLRFLRADAALRLTGEMVAEIGTCLRLIECAEDTPSIPVGDYSETLFTAWESARQSIQEAWDFESDPANLQPDVRRLNREVADFVRLQSTPSVSDDDRRHALDILLSPWPRREEVLLRDWFARDLPASEKAAMIVQEVLKVGIEPFTAPAPLPPISADDILLVVWMVIVSQ